MIGQRVLGKNEPPYIIAEIGVNHDGDRSRAIQLVDAAADAGADAVKVQFFKADRLLSRSSTLAHYQAAQGASEPRAILGALELPLEDLAEVVERIRSRNLHAIATVFNVSLVSAAASIPFHTFKTASTDLIHRPLIEALLATDRPLLLSTGASTLQEVRETASWVANHPHLFFQCVSAYPTPDDAASLRARQEMEALIPTALGYSDHTCSIDTGALAVAAGAVALEKHLTYDRSASGPDHVASLAPNDFAEYVRLAHRAWRMCGKREKTVLDIERDVRAVSRQSLVAAQDLPTGHRLRPSDIEIKRPGTGFSPAMLESIIGRMLRRPIGADDLIQPEHLE